MPTGKNSNTPGVTAKIAATVGIVEDELVILAGQSGLTKELIVGNLSKLTWWIRQTTGAVGATVNFQFAASIAAGAQDFQPLFQPFPVILAVESNGEIVKGGRRYRCRFDAPAGNAVTIRYFFSAVPM